MPSEKPMPSEEPTTLPTVDPTPVPAPVRIISDKERFNNKTISVNAGAATKLYNKGTIAELQINELYRGSINEGANIRLKLKNPNYKFTGTLTSIYNNGQICNVPMAQLEEGGKTLLIVIPQGQMLSGQNFSLKNIEIEAASKVTEEEDIKIDILSESLEQEKYNVTVANITTPAIVVEMESAKSMTIGSKETVQFKISENVQGYLQPKSQISLKLSHGHWDYKGLVERAAMMKQLSGFDTKKALEYSDEEYFKFATQINAYWLAKELIDEGNLKVSNGEPTNQHKEDYCQLQFTPSKQGDIEGDELILTLGKSTNQEAPKTSDKKTQIKIQAKMCAPISENSQKEMVLISSYAEKKNETKVANMNSNFTISMKEGALTISQNKKQKVEGNINILFAPKQKTNRVLTWVPSSMKVSKGWKLTQNIISHKRASNEPILSWTLSPVNGELLKATLTCKPDQTFDYENYNIIIYGKGIDAYCSSDDVNKISKAHQIILSADSKN